MRVVMISGLCSGPRLNAAGRLDDMSLGIQALLTDDFTVATDIAQQLHALNAVRRDVQAQMQIDALATLSTESVQDRYTLCLYQSQWHPGVVGLIAARLRERFHRPTLIFAGGNDGILKASGRSIPGFHLRDALDLVSKRHPTLLLSFGGHAAAVGLSIQEADFGALSDAFEQVAREWLPPHALLPILETDGELAPHEFALAFAMQLEQGIWGQAFPPPLYRGHFTVDTQRWVGEKHLRLRLRPAVGVAHDAIAFNQPNAWPERVMVVYRLDVNRFGGRVQLQLIIQHWDAAPLGE